MYLKAFTFDENDLNNGLSAEAVRLHGDELKGGRRCDVFTGYQSRGK